MIRLYFFALLVAATVTSSIARAETRTELYIDARIPAQELGEAPAVSDRVSMLQAVQAIPLRCGVDDGHGHGASEIDAAFAKARALYRGSMTAEAVLGHIVMTERMISEVQMLNAIELLARMRTSAAEQALSKIRRWSPVLATRFVSDSARREYRSAIERGIATTLDRSLKRVAAQYGYRF
jgi:hypothetical protein